MAEIPGYKSWLGSEKFKQWISAYIQSQLELLQQIRYDWIHHLINRLSLAAQQGNRVFICGNGGSLSNSQHFICDLNKGASDKFKIQFMGHCLGSNPSLTSAISNDYSYQDIFVKELQYYKPKAFDILIGTSVSGNSENVLRAMKYAKEIGMHTIAIVGGSGDNKIGDIADYNIGLNSQHFGRVEDVTMTLLHMACYFFMENIKEDK